MDETLRLFIRAGDGAWAVNKNKQIVFWNQSAAAMLGFNPAEAIGRSCADLLRGRNPHGKHICHQHCAIMNRARQGEPVRAFDLVVRRKDGQDVLLNVSTVATPETSENRTALIHLFRVLGEVNDRPGLLRIRLLGATIVQRTDDSFVTGKLWRRAKTRALMAILALQRGQPIHRERLAKIFWSELSFPAALRNLNTTVYNLRRSLEPSLKRGADSRYIIYENDNCLLADGADHWLDVEAFEQELKQARRETNPQTTIALYRHTLALYRGEFQADLSINISWPQGERLRLRELYLAGLQELGQLYEKQRLAQEANELYIKVIAIDPCRENAYRCLMRLALQRNDPAAAIVHYQHLVKALKRELAARPTPETHNLYKTALNLI